MRNSQQSILKNRLARFLRVVFFQALVVLCSLNGFGQKVEGDKYDEFVNRNKIFKPYAGYLTLASGMSYNPYMASFEKCSSLGLHFRTGNIHFNTGYHVSSDRFFMKRSNQLLSDIFFTAGYRKDTLKSNFGIWAGPVYGFGSTLAYVKDEDGVITNYYLSFHRIGLYVEAEYTFKIAYDFGLGISAYTSANKAYQVAGLKLHLYFSGAFRGSIQ